MMCFGDDFESLLEVKNLH